MKKTTVFKQLITNIITPLILVLLVLAYINYKRNNTLLLKSYEDKNFFIINEIKNTLSFQDFSLTLIEKDINRFMRRISNVLVSEYFNNTDTIEKANLERIRSELGIKQDIYVIDRNGRIINTTFLRDLNFNLFEIDEQHKEFLLGILDGGKFVSEKFSLEKTTEKLKKYTYQPTKDGKYIVELGTYSNEADKLIDSFRDHIEKVGSNHEEVISVDLFIGEEDPLSFTRNAKINEENAEIYRQTYIDKQSRTVSRKVNGNKYHYTFVYMDRENTDLYAGSVIRIVSDRSAEASKLFMELLTLISIFGITIVSLVILIYKRSKSIATPIKNLAEKTAKIEQGDLNIRADISGNNEISTLGKQFNSMIERLASYYSELEQKVDERTQEVVNQKEELEVQSKKINKLYKEVTDSINYARHIQTSVVLPTEMEMTEALSDHFLFYLPKDIVSGDFYWLSEQKERILIATADCTGHGVPGAFMSLIGNSLLNNIVDEQNITKPSDILNHLRKGIIESLNKRGSSGERNEGMDISLCSIDFKKKELDFSGAFIPLYIARGEELIIQKGDRQPVGNFGKFEHPFTNHKVKLEKGDMVYLFSDGFQDQFGGENNSKFMVGKFKKLLLSISKESSERQKELLKEALDTWRGKNNQIDDILIIGIRI